MFCNQPIYCRPGRSQTVGFYWSFSSFSLLMADFTVTAEVVLQVQAPPATVFMQEPQCQMPTARLFILVLPQKEQVYLACWLISIFFTIFRREAPQRVPYFPTIPTFLVRLAMSPEPKPKPEEELVMVLKHVNLPFSPLPTRGSRKERVPGTQTCSRKVPWTNSCVCWLKISSSVHRSSEAARSTH